MRAAWFESFGPASEVLLVGEQEKPRPGHGEVLVRLSCSAVNPSDVKKRAGSSPNLLDEGIVIPHSDGAGVIEATGKGVSADPVTAQVTMIFLFICLLCLRNLNNTVEKCHEEPAEDAHVWPNAEFPSKKRQDQFRLVKKVANSNR
ncbi:MAG: alcohol dehydrogenase catalytic domain-containing protein [Gammaproteobacteria bacterium]|nr:alcohol dehydrogenase catalytic domain-containing protein [Gammaproteobacteria bacterium]